MGFRVRARQQISPDAALLAKPKASQDNVPLVIWSHIR